MKCMKSGFFGLTEIRTEKPKPNISVFDFVKNQSVVVVWKTEYFKNRIELSV
jgi:hypothetical protein